MDWTSSLSDWLKALSESPEQLGLVYSVLLGASVFVVLLAVYFLLTGLRNPLRKRVDSVKEHGMATPSSIEQRLSSFDSVGQRLLPKEQSRRVRTQAMLRHAGFRSNQALQRFWGLKFATLALIPLLVFTMLGLTGAMHMNDVFMYTLVSTAPAYLIPDAMLARLARRRQEKLRRALPDAMDLLVVCSEAGLGLSAGIQRVASELMLTHPEMADELDLFSMQVRSGMDNRSALRDLESRTGLDDVQSLVAMLLQSMRFGTSIADTLRIFAEDLRDKRLQRAQEKAARIGTLMLFPLILCILPSFLLVVLGPAVFGTIAALSRSPLGGH